MDMEPVPPRDDLPRGGWAIRAPYIDGSVEAEDLADAYQMALRKRFESRK
jgi:hypothetical protein